MIFFVTLVILIGNFTPYLGLHWQITKSYRTEKVISCFNNSSHSEIDKCYHMSYNILFYGGKWYNYSMYKEQIISFKENHEVFFININE